MIPQILRDIIAAINSNGDSFAFFHGPKGWQNLVSDEIEDNWDTATLNADGKMLPAFYLDKPIRIQPNVLSGGALERKYICLGMFLYPSDLGNTPAEQDVILAKSLAAVDQFTLRLSEDTQNIKRYSVGQCYEVEHIFDTPLSGHAVPFEIVPRRFASVCLT